MRGCNFDRFGELTHQRWLSKRSLSGKVTVPVVEQLYEHVRDEYGMLEEGSRVIANVLKSYSGHFHGSRTEVARGLR